MKNYEKDVFEHLIYLIRNEDEDSRKWLMEENRELVEFWDAIEGMESSFKWLMENNYRQLAAAVDAMSGNDKAKVFLLSTGNRELAALIEAADGSQKAISWLLQHNFKGWVLVAKELFDKEKKKNKGFLGGLLNFGNPYK